MDPFATSHFSNDGLRHDLKTGIASDCMSLAVRLTRIAEFDDRKLYLQDGFPSMFAYCVHELHLSEGAAYRRITAARTALRFPAVLMAVADGRVHLRAVLMLAPRLTSGNVDELLAAATHKTRVELEQILAQRFPRPDLPERLQAIPSLPPFQMAAPAVEVDALIPSTGQPAAGPFDPLAPERVESSAPRARMTPLAPGRFGFQCTFDQETHDLFQYVQALMSHEIPAGEMALVLKGALRLAAAQLEKRKFAATDRPGHARPGTSPRHIPAAVKRAVRERDGGQCTFVSDAGHRCDARTLLELDHIEPVARGGKATTENVRLWCRSHNQHTAECLRGRVHERQARGGAAGGPQRQGRRSPARSDHPSDWKRTFMTKRSPLVRAGRLSGR